MRTRVKICGITRREDAQAAVHAGADAIGFVFYPPSPRAVTVEQAAAIRAKLPPFVTVVGLFVNEPSESVRQIADKVGLDLLQFHGDETPEQCRGFNRPYMKAIRMRPGIDLQQTCSDYSDAAGLLLDTYQKGVPGGTGQTFDWQQIPPSLQLPLVLAGGLEPGNVAEAIMQVAPFAVDVSGGVESAKGIKSADKILAFMRGVERAKQ